MLMHLLRRTENKILRFSQYFSIADNFIIAQNCLKPTCILIDDCVCKKVKYMPNIVVMMPKEKMTVTMLFFNKMINLEKIVMNENKSKVNVT